MVNIGTEFLSFKFIVGEGIVERTVFIKKHEGKDDAKPGERTLYIVNIPQFLTKKCLKELFVTYGEIEKIFIQSKPSSGPKPAGSKYFSQQRCKVGPKVGYIVFKRPISLKKALMPNDGPAVLPDELNTKSGKQRWIQDYNSQFIDAKDLNTEIETFMSEFDKNMEEEKQKAKAVEGVVDEDGWVTITKQSKKPKIPRNETISKKLIEKQKRAQAKLTLVNFYRSQLRDAKMDEMQELRKKFESDKKRLALMKAGRKFKPL